MPRTIRPIRSVHHLMLATVLGMFMAAPTAVAEPPAAEAAAQPAAAIPKPHPMLTLVGRPWQARGIETADGGRMDMDLSFSLLFDGAVVFERAVLRGVGPDDTPWSMIMESAYGREEGGRFPVFRVWSNGITASGTGTRSGGPASFRVVTEQDVPQVIDYAIVGGELSLKVSTGPIDPDRAPEVEATLGRGRSGTLAIPVAEPTGPVARLAPMAGTWVVSDTWDWGATVKGRNENRMGHGAGWLRVDTHVSDNGGPEYHRYRTWYIARQGAWLAWSIDREGALASQPVELAGEGEELSLLHRGEIRTDGGVLAGMMTQRNQMRGPNAYTWVVKSAPLGGDEQVLIDAVWRRKGTESDPLPALEPDAGGAAPVIRPPQPGGQPGGEAEAPVLMGMIGTGAADMGTDEMHGEAAEARPIDSALFDATGGAERGFSVEETVSAGPAECFRLWSSAEGVKAFLGVDANIELAVGGAYEWIFLPEEPEGRRGGEGCQVLAWVPGELIAFTWNAPPQQPESRGKRTWVVVRFEAVDGGFATRVQLDHRGFGDAAHWRETEAYFKEAWPRVLGAMKAHLAS